MNGKIFPMDNCHPLVRGESPGASLRSRPFADEDAGRQTRPGGPRHPLSHPYVRDVALVIAIGTASMGWAFAIIAGFHAMGVL